MVQRPHNEGGPDRGWWATMVGAAIAVIVYLITRS